MAAVTARIATPNARKHLRTLCNHWRHKFAVVHTDDRAHIPFSDTTHVDARADDTGIDVLIRDPDADALPRLQSVLAEHLQRFAREEALVFDWQPADPSASLS